MIVYQWYCFYLLSMQNFYCFSLLKRRFVFWMKLMIQVFCYFILYADLGWLRWLESDDFLRSFIYDVALSLQIISLIFSSKLRCLVSFSRELASQSKELDFEGLSKAYNSAWFMDFVIYEAWGELWRVSPYGSLIITVPTENQIFLVLRSLCARLVDRILRIRNSMPRLPWGSVTLEEELLPSENWGDRLKSGIGLALNIYLPRTLPSQ